MELIEFADLRPDEILPDDYVVFGGTFDPIHEGHVTVLRRLLQRFQTVIVAPTTGNPWKPEPPAPLGMRIEMIRLVLAAEALPCSTGAGPRIEIEHFPYMYSEELVDHLRSTRPGRLQWAVGADGAGSVKDWRNWSTKGVRTVVLPIEIDAHAAHVRIGSAQAHPAIRDYIRENKLYLR